MRYIPFLLLLTACRTLSAQNYSVDQHFFKNYELYKEATIENRRIKHELVAQLINKLDKNIFDVQEIGKSVLGKSIYIVKIGKGKKRVLLWSQMHGNESTATMALFDIFNFLSKSDSLDFIRKKILEETTLYSIPMLNPDGADSFMRRNAINIDINRDALRLVSPESKLLKKIRDSIDADYGFNLHDQSTLYSAGYTDKTATISLLAPPYDYAESVNEVRGRAIKLSVSLYEMLQKYIPGQVGKWGDDFEPRAFGDNMQKWGTSTVLIESGGYKNDPEKQFIRKLNFTAMLHAFHQIATSHYKDNVFEIYEKIPENKKYLYDLIVRNVDVEKKGNLYRYDIGIIQNEIDYDKNNKYYYSSSIAEMGDMSVYHGYYEIDGLGMTVEPGKVYPKLFSSEEALSHKSVKDILKQGYTHVKVKNISRSKQFTDLPINILHSNQSAKNGIYLYNRANFVLKKDDEVRFVVVNGFFYDVKQDVLHVVNCLTK